MIEHKHGKILNLSSVAAFWPVPTVTGFEAAADMGNGSKMFRKATKPEDVAKAGLRVLRLGKVLCYQGAFTKWMGFLSRLVPRSVTKKYAARVDK